MAKQLPETIKVGPFTLFRQRDATRKKWINKWGHSLHNLRLEKTREGWVADGSVLGYVTPYWQSNSPQPTPQEAVLAHIHHQLQQDLKAFNERHADLLGLLRAVAGAEDGL